ncbi:MAG TPA: hypothetical protein VJ377_04280 [Dehalococcoidales bacterium]|nr:hypothetical protein [Dehalococcoidales bacterium]
MFNRGPNDVVFLQAVRYAREKMPRGKVRMLYVDAAGKVYASAVGRSVYELARDNAARMARSHKSFATVGLESAPGRFIPTTVEIGPDEVWALEHILEHALKNGRLPDILKKYVRPIISLVEADREAVVAATSKSRRETRPVVRPRVLDRLPYYPERDIEISMPIYKAEYSYPLIVLKGLPRDEQTPANLGRLLVLDADGDIAIVKVPSRLFRSLEKGLSGMEGKSRRPACALISQQADSLAVSYMTVSQPQKKSLETLTRYFEETGGGKQSISSTARAVIVRARESTAARAIR